ncbi:MAG: hypothetical protein R6X02_31385 [Enhygromyxa sp.]
MVFHRCFTALIITTCLSACGPGPSLGSGSDVEQGDDESESEGESEGESESESGAGELDCRLAIRLDQCCNQAFAATVEEIEAEPCVAEWPVDWGTLPSELAAACIEAQPNWCEIVDCDYAQPASDMVGPDGEGGCRYLCPEDMHLAYRQAGCGEPPPVVECLGVPPPCADEYCSCAGEALWGCGQVGEPFRHLGPCE